MRTVVFTLVALVVLAPAAGAGNIGTFFGAMSTAQATGKGQTTVNATVGIADVTSFVGSFGYGFTDQMDGRVKLGIIDEEYFDTTFILGGDLRWQLWDIDRMPATRAKPFDLAVGGFLEWSSWSSDAVDEFIDSQTIFEIGFQVTGSRTFPMSNGSTLTPYGRLNIRHETLSVDMAPGMFVLEDFSDSQVAVGANAGVAWGVSPSFVLLGELQIDGNDGLFLGVDYRP
jgi:hypothetical protein